MDHGMLVSSKSTPLTGTPVLEENHHVIQQLTSIALFKSGNGVVTASNYGQLLLVADALEKNQHQHQNQNQRKVELENKVEEKRAMIKNQNTHNIKTFMNQLKNQMNNTLKNQMKVNSNPTKKTKLK